MVFPDFIDPRTPPGVVVAMVAAALLLDLLDFSKGCRNVACVFLVVYVTLVALKTLQRTLLYFRRAVFEKTQGTVTECTISRIVMEYPRLVKLRYAYVWNGVTYSSTAISPYFNFYSDTVKQVRQRSLSLEVGQTLEVLVNTKKPREAYLEMERLPADIGYGVLSLGMVLTVAVLKYVFA